MDKKTDLKFKIQPITSIKKKNNNDTSNLNSMQNSRFSRNDKSFSNRSFDNYNNKNLSY
jgi:hypothetical protein